MVLPSCFILVGPHALSGSASQLAAPPSTAHALATVPDSHECPDCPRASTVAWTDAPLHLRSLLVFFSGVGQFWRPHAPARSCASVAVRSSNRAPLGGLHALVNSVNLPSASSLRGKTGLCPCWDPPGQGGAIFSSTLPLFFVSTGFKGLLGGAIWFYPVWHKTTSNSSRCRW